MKKLSVSLLAFIMCCMLWACGQTTSVKESDEQTTTVKNEYATTEAEKKDTTEFL